MDHVAGPFVRAWPGGDGGMEAGMPPHGAYRWTGAGSTLVVPIVPICWIPVEPGASVRAPSGKLSGGWGMLWPEFGAGGDWLTPWANDGAAPNSSETASAQPVMTFMV